MATIKITKIAVLSIAILFFVILLYGWHKPVQPVQPVPPKNKPPVISGVNGATALKVQETGKWTIKASDPEKGILTYSVLWDDEAVGASTTALSKLTSHSQTADFTHSYSKPGVYHPTFIVTDNKGASVKRSISVSVGEATSAPYISSLSAYSGPVGTSLEIRGRNLNGHGFRTESEDEIFKIFKVWIENSKGVKGLLVGESDSNDQLIKVILKSHLCQFDIGQVESMPAGPGCSSWLYLAPGVYKIYVMSGGVKSNEVNFTITSPATASPITVLSPNGGEVWKGVSRQLIKWSAPSSVSSVAIYITSQNNSSYQIASSALNDGILEWMVPYLYLRNKQNVPDGQYKIGVCSATLNTCDYSDAPFTLSIITKNMDL